jgi:solute carrier family 35 (UDP-galactose transporter), member B1
LTRKLFTMLLSVIVYNHKLTKGQWLGTAVVFAGISVEAIVKRKGIVYHYFTPDLSKIYTDVHAKRVIQEKEKAKIKSL